MISGSDVGLSSLALDNDVCGALARDEVLTDPGLDPPDAKHWLIKVDVNLTITARRPYFAQRLTVRNFFQLVT